MQGNEVVVVPARFAYSDYLKWSVYVCQPGRAFRNGLTHIGFYAEGAIQRHVPGILYREDRVEFTTGEAARRRAGSDIDRRIGALIEPLLSNSERRTGHQYQVFLLSAPRDPATVSLDRPIANDTIASTGRPIAWARGQRYLNLAVLQRPGLKVTSDLPSS